MENTDPTSFKSILAGVKKLRDQESGDADKRITNANKASASITVNKTGVRNNAIPNSTRVVNSFNQERQVPSFNNSSTTRLDNSSTSKRSLTGKTVLVNTTQKENPLLNHLKNTNWRYISSTPTKKIYYDYFIRDRSVLFLTLSYYKLYVDYLLRRMKPLTSNNDNILIFVIDTDNNSNSNNNSNNETPSKASSSSEQALNEITKLCMFNGFTLLVAFNFEQAANYIEYLNT